MHPSSTKAGVYSRSNVGGSNPGLRTGPFQNQRSVSDFTPHSSSSSSSSSTEVLIRSPYKPSGEWGTNNQQQRNRISSQSTLSSLNGSPNSKTSTKGASRTASRSASRIATRSVSRTGSRACSTYDELFFDTVNAQISGISDVLLQKPSYSYGEISTTPKRRSLSRSTSTSSSRLSIATSFVSQSMLGPSRIQGSRHDSESLFSSQTLDNNSTKEVQSRIQVTVRPRPLSPEQFNTHDTPWFLDHPNSQVEHPEIGRFQYDHVFSTNDTNQNVFEVSAVPVIRKCLKGYNGTIFAYGMTGSGKTYSMRGVVRRSVQMIFDHSNKGNDLEKSPLSDLMDQDSNDSVFDDDNILNENTILADRINNTYSVQRISCSILEIYNEKLKDLLSDHKVLDPTSRRSSRVGTGNELKIVEDAQFGIKVKGLSEIEVKSSEQLIELINQGERLRSTDSTDYNYSSSRSHFIVTLKIFLKDSNDAEIVSMLNFCDLAGSEKAASHSDRRKEGSYINKSLLALGTVITKLSENGNGNASSVNKAHIPFRDSKLTRFLQPSLQGGSLISILCTIHLGSNVVGETTNTLRFGSRAKNVVLKLKRNDAEVDIENVLKENSVLKLEIERLKSIAAEIPSSSYNDAATFQIMKQEYPPMPMPNSRDSVLRDEDNHYELIAENNLLNEQVEHLKRLQIEDNIIRSQKYEEELTQLNQVLQDLILDIDTRRTCADIMTRLETKHRQYEMRLSEFESYVSHLENKLRLLEIDSARLAVSTPMPTPTLDAVPTPVPAPAAPALPSEDAELVQELTEALEEARQSMQRKDAVIRALQQARNV